MTPDALLDTNVLLRHVLSVHPDHSPRATALVEAIERGERAVRLSDTVIFGRWASESGLSFADSDHSSLAERLGLSRIVSFDRHMGRDPRVTGVEP